MQLKSIHDLENLEEIATFQNQVEDVTMRNKLCKQIFIRIS